MNERDVYRDSLMGLRVASAFQSRYGEETFAPIKEQVRKVKSALAKYVATFESKSKTVLDDPNVVDDLDVVDRYGQYLTIQVIVRSDPVFNMVRAFVAGASQIVTQTLVLPPKITLLVEKTLSEYFKDFQIDKHKDKWDITKNGEVPGILDAGSETKFPSGRYYDWYGFEKYLEQLQERVKQAPSTLASLQVDLDKYLEGQKAHTELLQQKSQVRQESKEKAKAEAGEKKTKAAWGAIYNDAPKIAAQLKASYELAMHSLKSLEIKGKTEEWVPWNDFSERADFPPSRLRKALREVSKHLQGNGAAGLSNRLEVQYKELAKAEAVVAKTPVIKEDDDWQRKIVPHDTLKKALELMTKQLEKCDLEVKAVWKDWQAHLKAMV
jgi:FtsZ-binding cell division protein ZapB